ncbi:GNAT family N-acetyltransferase [Oceanospirillum linum]|uniref:GNAT family N-acetyltransferase n=1 Tax=Oceanospirillum linum TaxID=966 RepID=UPI001358C613|nr:N-acetyltransferase [Oceanospirillum linum]
MTIRELTPRDARAFHYLRIRSISTDPTSFSVLLDEEESMSAAQIHSLLDRFNRSTSAALWGGFCAGYLVGMIGLEPNLGPVRQHSGIVTSLCVLPEYRGQKIAMALMNHLMDSARRNPQLESLVLEVSETAVAAIRLYRKVGFKETGREPKALAFGDQRFDLIRMSLFV